MILVKELVFCGCFLSFVTCSEYSVNMPPTLETIHGSCILIPCSFTTMESSVMSPAIGVWRKGSQWFKGSVDVFNSSRSENKLHGEILGDLTQRNCTSVLYNITKEYEDKYFFRLESKVKVTFPQNVSIKVTDMLPKPNLTPPQSFQEGIPASMTCAVASHCPHDPPVLKWSPELNHSVATLQTKEDGTQEVISELSFIPSHWEDGLNVSCVVTHNLQKPSSDPIQEAVHLNVLYGPKNLSVSLNPTRFVMGSLITLSCLGVSNPPINNYRWFRNTGSYLEEVNWTSQTFTFNITYSTTGVYHCEGRNTVGVFNSSRLRLKLPAHLHLIPKWLLIAGGFILFCVAVAVAVFLYYRQKKLQSQQQKEKGGGAELDIYINVTEDTIRKAAGTLPETCDSLYCNQLPSNRPKANSTDILSETDDIYANV